MFSNTAGSGFTANIQNLAGGKIIAQSGAAVRTLNGVSTVTNAGLLESASGVAVQMGTGLNTLILQTGSQIIGSADGGGGSASTLILQGTGSVTNAFTRFQTLQAQGSDWSWSGSGAFNSAQIQGTFNLTGTVSGAGASSDTLTLNGATVTGVAGFTNWPTVNITNGSQVTMDGTLVVGNATTGTGTVTIDASSTLLAGNGANGGSDIHSGPATLIFYCGLRDARAASSNVWLA